MNSVAIAVSPPQLTLVPQVPFRGAGHQHAAHWEAIEFFTVHGGLISIAQAARGDFAELVEENAPAFPKGSVSSKISLRIQLEDQPVYHHQVTALRVNRTADSISRGKLATTIAKEAHRHFGEKMTTGGRTFSFDEVFLGKFRRVSKGSWQPEFYIFL